MHVRAIVLASLLATAGLAGLAAAPTQAADKRAAGKGLGFVTAESRYGGATVSGPVRRGSHGRLEVRLPGGTWLECGLSCSETLRRETVDFWRNHGGRPGGLLGSGDGPGYLRFKF